MKDIQLTLVQHGNVFSEYNIHRVNVELIFFDTKATWKCTLGLH
jgi:hypothetical protein